MTIEGVVAMQACARIGAIHSVVFGGFSAQSLRDRMNDAGAVMLITSDGQFRGGKSIGLKTIADEAFALGGCECVKNVIVFKRTGGECNMVAGRDEWLHDLSARSGGNLRTRMGRGRASAVPALYLGFHRQAQGRPALDRRLPAARHHDHEVDLRHQAAGYSSGAPPTSAG